LSTLNNKTKHTRTREERNKLITRIIALFLAILMVAGAAYYAIYLMTLSISAESAYDETGTIDTSSLHNSGDVPVRVGLTYGDSITVGFEVTSTNGFTIGITETEGKCNFTPVWDLDMGKIAVTTDGNLSKSHMTYSVAASADAAQVGGFHIQVDCDKYNRTEFTEMLNLARKKLGAQGLAVIPAYVYTGYTIRAGEFTTRSEAEKWLSVVEGVFPGEVIYVTGASAYSVSVIDPNSDQILFEFDCGGKTELGLKAHEDVNGNTFMKTPAANIYDGVFAFSRCKTARVDGVQLTNIVPLEVYVAGVLPYEIPNTWPVEALKSFALTVRSFTLTHLGRHSSDGFDLCNTTHCQVYKGAGRTSAKVLQAVTETAGKVVVYDGTIVTAYYSSSVGGVTVSVKDAWGGGVDIPYLQAMETPWEQYLVHENGFWITEVTPEELSARLQKAGCKNLRGAIAAVEILDTAENSTYIKSLFVVDVYGNTATITNTDTVRTSLTPYVKSANFVVGKGSVEYTEYSPESTLPKEEPDTEFDEEEKREEKEEIKNVHTGTSSNYDKDFGYINLYDYHVLTESEEYVCDINESVTILTENGYQEYERQDIFVLSMETAYAFTGEDHVFTEVIVTEQLPEESHTTKVVDEKSTDTVVYKVAYAENKNNFIFVGKGSGHGVGISQYGAYDLANLGYSAEEILKAYFKGVEIVPYRSTAAWKNY